MSSDSSESDTLLPSSPAESHYDATIQHKAIDEPDVPTYFTQFIRNVTACKWLLGLLLPATMGLEIAHLVLALRRRPGWVEVWDEQQRIEVRRENATDIVGVVLSVRSHSAHRCKLRLVMLMICLGD